MYNGIFVSTLLFIIGLWGIFLTRKNLILILISIELMLLSINMNFIIFSTECDQHLLGQIFVLFILTVAAAESAIGLAIVVVYYRLRGLLAIDMISAMKG
jgi:NADH-quinone oxidoreductase subunit K